MEQLYRNAAQYLRRRDMTRQAHGGQRQRDSLRCDWQSAERRDVDVHLAEWPPAAKDAEIGRDGRVCLQRGRLACAENGQRRGDEVHAARQEYCAYDFRHG